MALRESVMGAPATDELEPALLAAARAGDSDAFGRLSDRYRRELLLHCYRMLGSIHDAEDAVQDTFVRAWSKIASFEGRAPLRAWLHAVATNTCLTAMRRSRRIRANQARARTGGTDPDVHGVEPVAFTPFPDRLLNDILDTHPGPAAQIERREQVGLAFLAAVQVLPARQRAALVLHDVLEWSAAEVAEALETSVAAVNSALQRARATLRRERAAGLIPRVHSPASADVERALVERFAHAWAACDVEGLALLLAEDVLLIAPQRRLRRTGRRSVVTFFSSLRPDGRFDRIRLIATGANGQPAFADYFEDVATGGHTAHGLMVLSMGDETIDGITGFDDPSLFPLFGLPMTLPRE